MDKQFLVNSDYGPNIEICISEIENCPLCKYSIVPETILNFVDTETDNAIFLYRCPKCHDFFMAVYSNVIDSSI